MPTLATGLSVSSDYVGIATQVSVAIPNTSKGDQTPSASLAIPVGLLYRVGYGNLVPIAPFTPVASINIVKDLQTPNNIGGVTYNTLGYSNPSNLYSAYPTNPTSIFGAAAVLVNVGYRSAPAYSNTYALGAQWPVSNFPVISTVLPIQIQGGTIGASSGAYHSTGSNFGPASTTVVTDYKPAVLTGNTTYYNAVAYPTQNVTSLSATYTQNDRTFVYFPALYQNGLSSNSQTSSATNGYAASQTVITDKGYVTPSITWSASSSIPKVLIANTASQAYAPSVTVVNPNAPNTANPSLLLASTIVSTLPANNVYGIFYVPESYTNTGKPNTQDNFQTAPGLGYQTNYNVLPQAQVKITPAQPNIVKGESNTTVITGAYNTMAQNIVISNDVWNRFSPTQTSTVSEVDFKPYNGINNYIAGTQVGQNGYYQSSATNGSYTHTPGTGSLGIAVVVNQSDPNHLPGNTSVTYTQNYISTGIQTSTINDNAQYQAGLPTNTFNIRYGKTIITDRYIPLNQIIVNQSDVWNNWFPTKTNTTGYSPISLIINRATQSVQTNFFQTGGSFDPTSPYLGASTAYWS